MTPSTNARIPYLDGLRGVAAVAVAVLHIFAERANHAFPAPVAMVIRQGHLGVQLFFVVSGFVIARVLSAAPLTGSSARMFLARRIVRLDPPYWASIALVIAAVAASNRLLPDRYAPLPAPSLIVAHLLYLQDFLGLAHISEVYWTLCFEIQFYLLLMLTFAVRQSLLRRARNGRWVDAVVFGLPASYALLALLEVVPSPRGSCFASWPLFLAGVLAQRHSVGALRSGWLLAYLGALVATAAAKDDPRPLVAALGAGSIVLAHRRQMLGRWLAGPTVQYLGKISYSLYLLHPIVGQRLPNLGHRLTGDSPGWVLVWGMLGLAAAIGASHLFWLCVESPSVALSRMLGSIRPQAAAPPPAPAVGR